MPYADTTLNDGDVLYVRASCGGGFGDPLERQPAMVQRDARNGFVSGEVAREVYGVIMKENGAVDAQATKVQRATLRTERQGAMR